jgi:broad specificity phosphatase PhoE
MHLFLIRHGETEHNVAGLLAGVSDSRLTNHGVLQTQRLGQHLTIDRNLEFTQIFASDLQRAFMTADEIATSQSTHRPSLRVPEVVQLEVLREQDFGSLELVPWASRTAQESLNPRLPSAQDPGFRPPETKESMAARAETFLANFIIPLLAIEEDSTSQELVAVVSHGLLLSALWRTLLRKFSPSSISLGRNIEPLGYGRPVEYLPSWTNTGFLELTILKSAIAHTSSVASELGHYKMTIHAVNSKDHLVDLKRSRGGLGSAAHDVKQQSLDGFFKRSTS